MASLNYFAEMVFQSPEFTQNNSPKYINDVTLCNIIVSCEKCLLGLYYSYK